MFPIRCYTCNTVLAHMHAQYAAALAQGDRADHALAEVGVHRMCCRRMFLGYVDTHAPQMAYPNTNVVLDRGGTVLLRRSKCTPDVSCD